MKMLVNVSLALNAILLLAVVVLLERVRVVGIDRNVQAEKTFQEAAVAFAAAQELSVSTEKKANEVRQTIAEAMSHLTNATVVAKEVVAKEVVKKTDTKVSAEQHRKNTKTIESLKRTKMVERFDVEMQTVTMNPKTWRDMTYTMKLGLAATCFEYLQYLDKGASVVFVDSFTNKKLGRYSEFRGLVVE